MKITICFSINLVERELGHLSALERLVNKTLRDSWALNVCIGVFIYFSIYFVKILSALERFVDGTVDETFLRESGDTIHLHWIAHLFQH